MSLLEARWLNFIQESKTGASKTGASESSHETHETHGKERATETDTEPVADMVEGLPTLHMTRLTCTLALT